MKRTILLHIVVLICIGTAFSQIEPFGLDGKRLTCLAVCGNEIYAGSDGEGVYGRSLKESGSAWVYLGLPNRRITTVYAYQDDTLGAVLIAGVAPRYGDGDTTLVYRAVLNIGQWLPFDSGMIHIEYSRALFRIGSIHGSGRDIFAAGDEVPDVGIYRLRNAKWERAVSQKGGGSMIYVIRVDCKAQVIWAGGAWGGVVPFAVKSTDNGKNWEFIDLLAPSSYSDNICISLAVDPVNSNIVYVGLVEGDLLRTTDTGRTWNVLIPRRSAPFVALAIDPQHPDHIYGGVDSMVSETFDGWRTWRNTLLPGSLRTSSSVVVDPDSSNVAYVAAYGSGVFRYRSIVTVVGDIPQPPQEFSLYQNFPNPFNSTTMIEFSLPHSEAEVNLTVYDVLGRKIITLVDVSKPAGKCRVEWDGRSQEGCSVASGVYICRLSTGGEMRTRKMILSR